MSPSSLQVGIWVATLGLVVGAIIDARILKVPNWLNFPLAFAGIAWCTLTGGLHGLGFSLAGLLVGLVPLYFIHAIGWVGAGDVKLMAAAGAWIGPWVTLGALAATIMTGGLMGAAMMVASGDAIAHVARMWTIADEVVHVRHIDRLAEAAAERKPRMRLLPYAVPMAVGSIAYFLWAGLLP